MSKIILHCDLDAFFCRAEEIKNPSLEGKAFLVGGDGRKGIVSTCSYEARKYGVHSGMPTFQAKMLCKDIIILGVDFKYYNLLSREFIFFLKKYSSKIEQVSVDECFLDLTDYYSRSGQRIDDILLEIQRDLFKKTQLKVSIGVGTTKFIAKMASDYKKPMGITIIRNKDIERMLFPLPVKSFFGIGKKTAPKLKEIGIDTIGDLYNHIKNQDYKLFNLIGENYCQDIINLLEGKSSDVVSTQIHDPKSIGMSRTLDFDTNDVSIIKKMLKYQIKEVTNSLVAENKFAKTISLVYKDASHEDNFKAKSFSKTFDNYTQNADYIEKETIKLFNSTYDGHIIRLIGFTLKNFKNKKEVATQMTFYDCEQYEKEDKTYKILNILNSEMHKKVFKKLSDLE